MHLDLDEFSSPFFLFVSAESCWKCGATCPVVGLASAGSGDEGEAQDEDDSEPFMLHDIEFMPDEFLAAIHQVQPHYELRRSRTTGMSCFVNTCACGAHFGDSYLFDRPGGAFFPRTAEEAGDIEVHKLPIVGTFKFECSYGLGTGCLILKHGKRLP